MISVIALIGRPNVGKSTLFNRLTKTKDALVADFPSLTRDRKYGKAEFNGQEFIIIDTGGINSKERGIEIHTISQSLIAIEEADIIFFIVDMHSGLMPADYKIAKHLRIHKKHTYLLANKTDNLDFNNILYDFYNLGIGDVYPISASCGFGINKLIQKVINFNAIQKITENNIELSKEKVNKYYYLTNKNKIIIKKNEKKTSNIDLMPIKLAIVGRPNVGKSTLINCILGEERVVVYNLPGTTSDSIYIPMKRNGYKYILIDTAGIRKRSKIIKDIEKFSIIKTLQSIKESDVVLIIVDAKQGISDQDLSLLSFILNSGRSLIIVINKWDDVSKKNRQLLKNILYLRLNFINFIKIHFISALHGNGINNLFESINETYKSSIRKIKTTLLTNIMKMAETEHQPPLICGNRVKMKYAHLGGYHPIIIVIHGNKVTNLPNSYQRYLINYFQYKLQIIGTKICIQFKEGYNPYINKKIY
ncbi:MAG: ribosome biogenesis GTPase Der [Arsenophonus endosymbiont of Ceratovacuna japonica]